MPRESHGANERLIQCLMCSQARMLFPDRWMDLARFNRIDRRHARSGTFIKVPKRLDDLADFQPLSAFYPAAEGEAQFILIDLSEQFLGAYERGMLTFDMPITSGTVAQETQRQTFIIERPARDSALGAARHGRRSRAQSG